MPKVGAYSFGLSPIHAIVKALHAVGKVPPGGKQHMPRCVLVAFLGILLACPKEWVKTASAYCLAPITVCCVFSVAGGLPDILLWRPSDKSAKLVEVKGPRDRLSPQQ